jgi:hypothetical protein
MGSIGNGLLSSNSKKLNKRKESKMKTVKRRTEYFTYVHFDKSDGIIEDVKDYVDEESDCIHNLLPDCEIYSDIIEWHFSDKNGNKVEMEDAFTEENVGVDDLEEGQYRVYFSRTIESDFQGEDYNLKGWMTTDDYFIGKENK